MENPKVSIIIPCYNVEKYIEECLDSINSQTYNNLEIICVDDGSTDDTLSILKAFESAYPDITIIHQINRGLSEARNTGIRLATGDYIVFIDSDDFIEPDTIEKCIKAFNTYDIDCVIYGARAFANDNKVDFTYMDSLNLWLKNKYSSLSKVDYETVYRTSTTVWNKMFKLKHIKGKIEFIPNLIYEDSYFTPRLLHSFKNVYFIDGVQYHYRIRSNSIISDTDKNKDFDKAMHCLYNWDKLIRELSYNKDFIINNKSWMLKELRDRIRFVEKKSPEEEKDKIEKEHEKRINYIEEIYNIYKMKGD